VYLLVKDVNKDVRPSTDVSGWWDSSIEGDLEAVKDISFVRETPFVFFDHFFLVRLDPAKRYDSAIFSGITDAIEEHYDPERTTGLYSGASLFRDLEFDRIYEGVYRRLGVAGVQIVPYHYKEFTWNPSESDPVADATAMFGSSYGGWYEFWMGSPYDDDWRMVRVYKEFVAVTGECSIYDYGTDGNTLADGGVVGTREGSKVHISVFPSYSGNVLLSMKCFWLVEKGGVIPVGCNRPFEFGARRLAKTNYYNKDFGDGVRFVYGI
jgi:hypothetical protein